VGLLAALGALAPAGCGNRPRAPALQDEPVYQNDREGFRFLVPDGWTQHARAELPPGPAEQERILVEYQRLQADKPNVFRVSLIDLPESKNLEQYLRSRWPGQPLQPEGAPEPVEVDGVTGSHWVFRAVEGGQVLREDVYVFRREARVYLFSGIYPPDDAPPRQEVRRTVEGIRWKQ
jgi:hypothetical protein